MAKTIIVTGANRGLGAVLVASLLASPEKYNIIATSRTPFKLPETKAGGNTVTRQELDVSSASSITAFAKAIREQYGTIDVLVNNAGVAFLDKAPKEAARPTIETNLYGPMQLCDELAPIVKEGGRIVNVSSIMSLMVLQKAPTAMKATFLAKDDKKLDIAGVRKLADQYVTAAENGTDSADFGQSDAMYGPYAISKAFLSKATEAYAEKFPKILINSCCPGWCATDMGSSAVVGATPYKSVEDGARILYNVAVKDIGKTTGHYFAEPTNADKGEGKPSIWGTV